MTVRSFFLWGTTGLCTALAAPAVAGPTYESASGGTMHWYGHLNAAVGTIDDSVQSKTVVGDAANSISRLGLRVAQPLAGGMEFRFRFESALGITELADFDQTGLTGPVGWRRGDLRHVDFALAGDWGTLSAGQGSMAADGAAEVGLSAVDLVLYSGNVDFNAGFQFRDAAGNLTGVTLGDAFDNLDGSRRGRIRYDSPDFSGFTVSAAYGKNILSSGDDDDYADIGLGYENDFGTVEVQAALAYQHRNRSTGNNRNTIVGSAAIAFDNGLSFGFATGQQTVDGGANDPNYYYLQAAYDAEWFAIGKTAFGIDYFNGKDYNSSGSKSTITGLGVVQHFDNADIEAYLAYQVHSFEEVGINYQDVSTVVLGARWNF